MKNEFEIITTRVATSDSFAEFLRGEYPTGDISSTDYLNWEYIHNPFGPAYVTLACSIGKDIASQYALLPIKLAVAGKEVDATLSLNTLTAKEYRGKGLFLKTAQSCYDACAADGVSCTIGIPNQHSYPGFTKRLNFLHAGNLVFSLKLLRPLNILQSVVRRPQGKKGKDIPLVMTDLVGMHPDISMFDPVQDKNLYADFLERWKQNVKVMIDRMPAYLRWRYLEHPTRKYYLVKHVVQGQMKAWAVFRALHIYGMKTCVLMDFFCDDDDAGRSLLDFVSVTAKNNALDIMIAATASREGIYLVLHKSGFFRVPDYFLPQKLPFILKMHRQEEDQAMFADLNNWHFMFGDYDIF